MLPFKKNESLFPLTWPKKTRVGRSEHLSYYFRHYILVKEVILDNIGGDNLFSRGKNCHVVFNDNQATLIQISCFHAKWQHNSTETVFSGCCFRKCRKQETNNFFKAQLLFVSGKKTKNVCLSLRCHMSICPRIMM